MEPPIPVTWLDADLEVSLCERDTFQASSIQRIYRYWNGEAAPPGRGFTCMLRWSANYFVAIFETENSDEVVVSESPILDSKTIGLWERDVCEIFIAPDRNEPRKYFEFELAPTGEWLDLAIDSTSGERVTDWDYRSHMHVAAKIEKDRIVMAMKIPWEALGKKPKAGDVWLGNIFRCVGKDPTRGYVTWQPTLTENPNFHVPEAFGEFVFVK